MSARRLAVYLIPLPALGPVAGAAAATSTVGTITQLSTPTATDQQDSPAISGERVLWTNFQSFPAGGSNFDIELLDLSQPGAGPVNLTNTPDEEEFLEDIDGSRAVWTHTAATQPGDIILDDLSNHSLTSIASSGSGLSFQQPAVGGRYVAFVRETTQIDIDAYDAQTGLPVAQQVTNDAAAQVRPRVSGDVIVYEDYNEPNGDIVGYCVSRQTHFPIATGPAAQITPDIAGNTVVWLQQNGPGDDQIWAEVIDTTNCRAGAARQLTSVASTKTQPRVSGSIVEWTDDRNGTLDLYSYDLARNVETPLVKGADNQFLADIDANRVVYTDDAAVGGQPRAEHVMLLALDQTPPMLSVPADITVNATSGAAAQVAYAASASDDVDPAPSVACSPASGSVFPIGATTVTCTATDAAGNSAAKRFTVTVSAPVFGASPSPLAFDDQLVNTSATKTLTLTNSGNGALEVTSRTLGGANAGDFLVSGGSCTTTLAPSASCTVQIRFRPSAAGARQASLSVTDNAAQGPQQVALSGRGCRVIVIQLGGVHLCL